MTKRQVTLLQKRMNARLAARGRAKIPVDGKMGPKTKQAVHVLKYVLGFPLGRLDSGPSWYFRRVVGHPGLRPPRYLQRAKDRKRFQEKENVGGVVGVKDIGKGAFGVDWAWGRPDIPELVRNHVKFACRYLSFDPSKNLTPDEAKRLSAAGIALIVVWETSANRALSGYDAGKKDGKAALYQALRCGLPSGRPIYAAVDFDATPAQQGSINAYLRGFSVALDGHPVGVYGSYYVVNRCLAAGTASYGWQTYAWSGGLVSPKAHLYQYLNGQRLANLNCDYNKALRSDFGEWRV